MRLTRLWLLALLLLPATGSAQIIRGRVVDETTGKHVSMAHITVLAAHSDSVIVRRVAETGNFDIVLDTADEYRLHVAAYGYVAFTTNTLNVAEKTIITLDVRLQADAIPLDAVRVVAERPEPFFMTDIRQRRRMGAGTFLLRQEMDERSTAELHTILAEAAGGDIENVILPGTMYTVPLVTLRAARMGNRECFATLYLDGVRIFENDTTMLELEGVRLFMQTRPQDIEAIEIYKGASQVPAEYSGGTANCGVIAVWRRTGYEPKFADPVYLGEPRLRASISGGNASMSGAYAPDPATSLRFGALLGVNRYISIDIGVTTARHQLNAAATADITRGWDPESWKLPPGTRAVRIVTFGVGPQLELPALLRFQPIIGVNAVLAYRGFSLDHAGSGSSDYASFGWGGGFSGAIERPLTARVALRVTASRDWVNFERYYYVQSEALSSPVTWRHSALRLSVAYAFGQRF